MRNAREILALRNTLHHALTYDEIRGIRWHTITAEASPAIARGWTGDEIARWAIGDLGPHTDNIGATIVTTIRELAKIDPPRDTTPQPTHISDIRRAQAAAIAASANVDHTAWAARVRGHNTRQIGAT